jgi:hypothetical protein
MAVVSQKAVLRALNQCGHGLRFSMSIARRHESFTIAATWSDRFTEGAACEEEAGSVELCCMKLDASESTCN